MSGIMLLHPDAVICRQKEIKAILGYIKCGKNLHIYGSDGTGKNVFKDIYHMTKGNPGLMEKIIAKILKPEYHGGGHINLKLIMLDIKIEGTNKERRSLDWENLKQ